jgi:hypothetical protein
MISHSEAQELHRLIGTILLQVTNRAQMDIFEPDVERALELASLVAYDLDPDNTDPIQEALPGGDLAHNLGKETPMSKTPLEVLVARKEELGRLKHEAELRSNRLAEESMEAGDQAREYNADLLEIHKAIDALKKAGVGI